MRKFITKSLLFTLPIWGFLIAICFVADGGTDAFYLRFTTPQQKSLILGTSRAAQGLQPEVFKHVLDREISNFSFTASYSPFGPVYYESIKRKHLPEQGGTFIVTADPWSISCWNGSVEDPSKFRENNLGLKKVSVVDSDPNFFYLYEVFAHDIKGLASNPDPHMYLHEDGWLEIMGIPMDSMNVAQRMDKKIASYTTVSLDAKPSNMRIEYLIKTIEYLREYGEVYLVRLPVHPRMLELEQQLMPDFETRIEEAINLSTAYLDMNPQNREYQYTDGNHLYKESGKEVSKVIAHWILEQEKRNGAGK